MPSTLVLEQTEDHTKLPFSEYVAHYVKASPDFIEGIGRGLAALRAGKVRPWGDIKRDLGLGSSPAV